MIYSVSDEEMSLFCERHFHHPDAHFHGTLVIRERPRSKQSVAHIPKAIRPHFTFVGQEDASDWGAGWKQTFWEIQLPQPALQILLKKRFPAHGEPDEFDPFAHFVDEITSYRVFFAARYFNEAHRSYELDLSVSLDEQKTPLSVLKEITGAPEQFYPPQRTWVVQQMRQWREKHFSWYSERRATETVLEILTTECLALRGMADHDPRMQRLGDRNQTRAVLRQSTWDLCEYVSCSRCTWLGFENGCLDTRQWGDGGAKTRPRPVLVAVDQHTGEGTYLCPDCFQKEDRKSISTE